MLIRKIQMLSTQDEDKAALGLVLMNSMSDSPNSVDNFDLLFKIAMKGKV